MSEISFIQHFRINFKLAVPIMLGQVSHVVTGMADSIMVGQIGSEYLAASAFSNAVYHILFVFGIGLGTGLTPLVGIANGEQNNRKISSLLKNGLLIYFVSGLIISGLNFLILPFFGIMGQTDIVVELAKPYFITLILSLIPYMVFLSLKQFAEGIEDTKTAMIIAISFNILNIILNYLLIHGIWIFPEWKLFGAGIATLISRTVGAIAFFLVLMYAKKFKTYYKLMLAARFNIKEIIQLFRIGIPIGFQLLLEVTVFALGGIMVGWSGQNALAAHQIALTLASFTFLAAQGLSSAGTIRLSNYLGENKLHLIKSTGNSIIFLVVLVMSSSSLIFYFFRFYLADFFVNEADVINLTGNLLIIAALFQIFDGLQVAGHSLLRGLKDVKIPTIISFVTYWVIGVALCYYLSSVAGYGAFGVWYGYLTTLVIISISLLIRFYYVVKFKINSLIE